ncbi:MAG: hydroxyacid dehydrogenase [Armatimonadetes bacterium]|nr:hydroxyacid dehydrogenase [Armatimonadota bacterium]
MMNNIQGEPLNAVFILGADAFERTYSPKDRAELGEFVRFVHPPITGGITPEHSAVLAETDIVFSGWGAPVVDAAFLSAVPRLRAFFYGAGATGGLIHQAVFDRGIVVSSANDINAAPVAEWAFAMVVLSLKNAFRWMRHAHGSGAFPREMPGIRGAYRTTVGLVSFGAIAKQLRGRLRTLDVEVLVHDPFLTEADAMRWNVRPMTLGELFRESDVVSLHTPWLPETEGMINGELIATMKPDATLLNTARGAIVREAELMTVLAARPDLNAVLDVTHPEPPPPGYALWTLPNVFLTPHIAGSVGREPLRMGRFMVDEFHRFRRGEPLLGEIVPQATANTAHRIPTK